MPEFSLFGVPVRVDPTFFLFAGYFAWVAGDGMAGMVSVALAIFLSILVHEAGHALMARQQGRSGIAITLLAFGGLTHSRPGAYSNMQQLLLSLAGPAASLLFGGLAIVIAVSGLPLPGTVPVLVQYLIFLNLFWGIFNLLPIFPMDGGNALGHMLSMKFPRRGWDWTHRVGVVGSGLLILWAISVGSVFLAIFGVLFAWQNWQRLQGPGW
ncbi:MAG: hypothetical protein EP330_18475 [Deltaproteobacteria bacterium]|nr:MAG: hypothetical protein EP330_18475 [Deltaproteobacteria bacterium]